MRFVRCWSLKSWINWRLLSIMAIYSSSSPPTYVIFLWRVHTVFLPVFLVLLFLPTTDAGFTDLGFWLWFSAVNQVFLAPAVLIKVSWWVSAGFSSRRFTVWSGLVSLFHGLVLPVVLCIWCTSELLLECVWDMSTIGPPALFKLSLFDSPFQGRDWPLPSLSTLSAPATNTNNTTRHPPVCINNTQPTTATSLDPGHHSTRLRKRIHLHHRHQTTPPPPESQ